VDEKVFAGWHPSSVFRKAAACDHGMNAITHLRVTVQILIPAEKMQELYPKVRKGLRKVWSLGAVKRI
jgi:hypothetical protein